MALTGCLLALGLTACQADQISIAWDEGEDTTGSTTLTVPAGFRGMKLIRWSGDGSCDEPKLGFRAKNAGEPGGELIENSLYSYTEGSGSGYFFVKLNYNGQYNYSTIRLICERDWFPDTWSNLLRIELPSPVDILIVHPSGLDPLPRGMIQTRSIDGTNLSTQTYEPGNEYRPVRPGLQYNGRALGMLDQEVRVKFKPHPDGRFWTGTCPSSPATFVVRPGDQVDGSGYASPSCDFRVVGSPGQGAFRERQVDEVMIRAVTPLAVTVSGPGDSPGLYGIRVGSADAGGFRPAAEVCASTRSTSCEAKVVPGDTVTVGLKPPTDAGIALQGTCPSGATFQITSSSATNVDGYATACASFTPSNSTTDISVQKVPVRSLTVTGPADRPGLFGIAIVSAPPVTRTVCTDTTKACTATFPAGGNVIAGFKPPSEGTLVGTCPGTGSAFTVTAASWTDDSGYHFPCPQSITPSVNSTTLAVDYVPPYVPPPPPSTVTVTVTGPCYGVSCDDTQLAYAYGVKVGDSVCTNSAVACSATVAAGSPIRIGIQPPTGSPGGWNVFPGDCPGGGRFSITTLSGPLEGGYVFEPCLTFTPGANTTISIGRS
jgi:hypothetical protein